ncbi:MAG: SDR family NAD(P)-dependent oxidoreductase [Tenericutes bacterium]|nr:SDR family NAD(P)-dependent oxidoreductase [Mycoplasmatota bacterium]
MKKAEWTIDQVNDLTDKVIIVTGANSGLGYESSKKFVSKNATVIMACRSIEKGNEAKALILKDYEKANIITMMLDLGSLKSITAFVNDFKSKYKRLDILLNNAGVMTVPYGKTEDGFEIQNGVNHLGPFALTAQLFDLLKNTKNSRIVNVSSIAHKQGKMDFDNYLFEKGDYKKMKSYAKSKLSNLLFTYELDRRIKEKNYDIKVLAAHPGISSTNLGRYIQGKKSTNPFLKFAIKFGQPPVMGCLPEVRAALDESAVGGTYYGPDSFTQMKGNPKVVKSSKRSHSLEDAKKLWEVSEKLTQLEFNV